MIATAALAIAAAGLAGAGLVGRAQRAGPVRSFEWTTYGANLASTRYAPLDQIDRHNFSTLQIAWRLGTTTLRAAARHPLFSHPAGGRRRALQHVSGPSGAERLVCALPQ